LKDYKFNKFLAGSKIVVTFTVHQDRIVLAKIEDFQRADGEYEEVFGLRT
jgi:hypothetical protein